MERHNTKTARRSVVGVDLPRKGVKGVDRLVRLEGELHAKLREISEGEGRRINFMVNEAIRQWLGRRQEVAR